MFSFDGLWDTGVDFGALKIKVNGTQVTGTFGKHGGELNQVIINGPFMKGIWRQRAVGGYGTTMGSFHFKLDPNGQSFKGTWTYGDDLAGTEGGEWNGIRINNPGFTNPPDPV